MGSLRKNSLFGNLETVKVIKNSAVLTVIRSGCSGGTEFLDQVAMAIKC